MKVKFKINLIFIFVIALFVVMSFGCSKKKTILDEYKDKGYKITVRYNANGGNYLDRPGLEVIDLINPNDYPEVNGKRQIKLLDPTSNKRQSGGSEGIYLTKTSSFLLGWYQTRTIKTNEDNKAIDENGNTLVLINDSYYLESDTTVPSNPAYEYSNRWDFSSSVLEYSDEMGDVELTLYAAWQPLFRFDYYYQEDGAWKLYKSQNYDYMVAHKDSSYADSDTIWMPYWNDGAVVYEHSYASGKKYVFPTRSGYTFKAAYLDENLTVQINDTLTHGGTVDYINGSTSNGVLNIYVVFDEGELYNISSSEQLIKYANLNGWYTIENDLDFDGLSWPTLFSNSMFNGKIIAKDGVKKEFKNINVNYNNAGSSDNVLGGLFGGFSKEVVVNNIYFNNITLDITNVSGKINNSHFGLLAGNIDDNASITNVSISGNMLIGPVYLPTRSSSSQRNYINLVACGNNSNITVVGDIGLCVYGNKISSKYYYSLDPFTVSVDENLNVTYTEFINQYKYKDSNGETQNYLDKYTIVYKDNGSN